MQPLVRLASLAALSAFPLSISAQAPAVSPVSIHGYLTQAYGITDRHQIAGMTNLGARDCRARKPITGRILPFPFSSA